MTANSVILRATGVSKAFQINTPGGRRTTVNAVRDVDLSLAEGEVLGLVGESGSGKSTLGRILMRLTDPSAGRIEFMGSDITRVEGQRKRLLYRDLRMVFQDPYSSLNPRRTIGQIVAEPLLIHRLARGAKLRERVNQLFERCGLDPDWRDRYPHQMSGGQRQRVGIARALSLEPRVLIADEPVSALDVSVQAGILNLLRDLQADMRFSCLFISHDLNVVQYLSDRVAVMYRGEIVEMAETTSLFSEPVHPYTKELLSAELPLHSSPSP